MSMYQKCLIMLFPDEITYNLYTFDNDRDREVFHITNPFLINAVYDNQFQELVPTEYTDISLKLNKKYHNRIYF